MTRDDLIGIFPNIRSPHRYQPGMIIIYHDDNTFSQNKGGPLVLGTFIDYSRKGNGANAVVKKRLGEQRLLNQRNIIGYLP